MGREPVIGVAELPALDDGDASSSDDESVDEDDGAISEGHIDEHDIDEDDLVEDELDEDEYQPRGALREFVAAFTFVSDINSDIMAFPVRTRRMLREAVTTFWFRPERRPARSGIRGYLVTTFRARHLANTSRFP